MTSNESTCAPTTTTTTTNTATINNKKRKRTEWRVFPPNKRKQYTYKDGDLVLVKSLSNNNQDGNKSVWKNGTFQKKKQEDNGVSIILLNSDDGDKEKEKSLLLKEKELKRRLFPQFSSSASSPSVIVTPETNYFRQMANQVNARDKILEIGCSTGETSKLLIPLCDTWVGLDTSEQMIAQCKASAIASDDSDDDGKETCHLAVVDALVDPTKAKEESTKLGDPSVIFIDIGGNRECINVLRMMSWVLDVFAPRLVVVKSRELFHSIKASSAASIDDGTGLIANGNDWFLQRKQQRALPKHPLKAPMVLSPKDGKTPICRYHNYHKHGCGKPDGVCPLDHDHCHACQIPGHIAKLCPTLSTNRNTVTIANNK
eukprot:scaffold3267_cov140-Cylindrotheca_fusiformis.AAC.2